MTAILYPVARNAEQALARPTGRAARQSDAQRTAGDSVTFVTESVGPVFATQAAALAAYDGRIDDAPAASALAPEDRYCRLVEQLAEGSPRAAPVAATYADGRRWPKPPTAPQTVWRMAISYWRIGASDAFAAPQARQARRAGGALDARTLRAIAETPLRPVKPQRALDIGLFEIRPPEAPHIVMPDE